jgi:hypothetical protein
MDIYRIEEPRHAFQLTELCKKIQEGKLPQTVYKWNLIQTWKRKILLNSPLGKCFSVERIHKH